MAANQKDVFVIQKHGSKTYWNRCGRAFVNRYFSGKENPMATQVKVDFGTLKASVQISSVLDHYGVKYRSVNENYLRADCPLPTHTSKESKGSFAVNRDKNIWCCKSTSCNQSAKKKGGDVLDFVSLMEGSPVLEAARKLLDWFPQNEGTKKPDVKSGEVASPNPTPVPEKSEPLLNKPLGFELKGITYHPYLKDRGISEELAGQFGIGFFPGKGSMSGRVVIPIRDEEGQLVAYAGRAIDNSEPKYKLPVGFHKGLVLFNRHAIKGDTVTVVEGFFGALKVAEAGFPVVALMGSTLSDAQERLLRCFKYITLLLDPDAAGAAGITEILPRLSKSHYVRVAQNQKPPDEMSVEEIRNTLRYACPLPAPR
jgi:DNA primase